MRVGFLVFRGCSLLRQQTRRDHAVDKAIVRITGVYQQWKPAIPLRLSSKPPVSLTSISALLLLEACLGGTGSLDNASTAYRGQTEPCKRHP